jgi:hypothetical protein
MIISIQYDNNFVYRISLISPIPLNKPAKNEHQQPGCVAIPDGTKDVMFEACR